MDAEKIKKENTRALHALGINVINHLPYLDEASFRNSEIVAKRMMVILAIFQLYLEAPKHIIKTWLKVNSLESFITKKEKEFLETEYEDLPEQDQIDIYWYVEALWALAWAGGYHNSLTFNTEVEDTLASMIPNIQENESIDEFIKEFKLRDQDEIFKMLDKFYRAHWFARNLRKNGQESNLVDLDIIIERRKALEYICYLEFDWEEISLDT